VEDSGGLLQNSGTAGEIGICSGESKLQKTEGALQALTTA